MDFESILATIQPFVIMLAALLGATVTAIWIAVVIWAFRDIRARTRDVFAQILATLLVLIFLPLFPLPGLILYMILRPRETLAEVYERSLEEEALLQSIEERLACPGCNRRIEESFMVCPTCHTRLKKACPTCGRLLHLRWNICPYCGAVQTAAKPAMALPAQPAAEVPRIPSAASTEILEPAVEARPRQKAQPVDDDPHEDWPESAPEPGRDDFATRPAIEAEDEGQVEPGPEPEPALEAETEPEVTPGPEARTETLPFDFD